MSLDRARGTFKPSDVVQTLLVPMQVEVSKLSSLWMTFIPVTLIGISIVLVPKPCTFKNGTDIS